MELEDNKRRRRVGESEEAALLAVASPHLRSMIITALDTGMRRGEMLALRFGDIDWTRRMITLRGATTKSRRTRLVPVGTARLLAVLEWLWLDSAGERKADDVPVFSNETGEALKTFKKAWAVAVLKAHGVDARWRKGVYKDLSTDCQQRFRDINLHWHDLRHEYASGWSSAAFRSPRCATCSAMRRSSPPSVTTISDWRRCRLQLSGWKEARRSTRRSMPRTTCPP
jgi:integrase